MNLGSIVVLLVILLIVGLDIRYLFKNGIDSCAGDCGGCGSTCKWQNDFKKAQKHIRRQRKVKQFLQRFFPNIQI